ncbi:hypothetical protein FXO37_34327 [Capsicum annuum]|nr:hypothetical protein FXO37_34327 [Capsicum annuum]
MSHLVLVNECDIYLFAQYITVYPENGSCMSLPTPVSWWNPLNALLKHGITAEKQRNRAIKWSTAKPIRVPKLYTIMMPLIRDRSTDYFYDVCHMKKLSKPCKKEWAFLGRVGSKSSPTCCGAFVRERVDVIGAPLGFYRDCPTFALTHHLVIWFVAAQVYPGVPFTRYAILGDDIIIEDEPVAERYHELILPLNVQFLLEKSLVSSVGDLEFAKWFFLRGVTEKFFPVSCHMLRSLVSSISLVPVMRAIMSKNLPLSYHLQEAGYRVYTRSTTPLYDGGQKGVQKSLVDLFFYHVSHTLI